VHGSRMLRPLKGRHAFKELGVSLGGSVPCGISACRNLRCWDSASSRTLAESSARVALRSLRQQVEAIASAAARAQQNQCAPAIVMRLECLRNGRDPHCCCSLVGRHYSVVTTLHPSALKAAAVKPCWLAQSTAAPSTSVEFAYVHRCAQACALLNE
jgi:hypothetical protein